MAPRNPLVVIDANVWFSRTQRDWVGMLYTTPELPPFEVKWTEDILAELVYNLRKQHPTWEGARITAIRDRMTEVFESGRVEDFSVGGDYRGHDPHDAHVHAAALECRADYLVTNDRAGFVWEGNESPYEVMTADEFFLLVDDACPENVAEVSVNMSKYWIKRAGEADEPKRLRNAGCPEFSERVRRHLQHMRHSF